ncbi:MAG: AMP-binding protein, partial [Blastocatellia bacterium]|nr:AMP-binding protein [Blastocatellia bacterium]
MQQGMLFHALLDQESRLYEEVFSIRLRGTINREAFQHAWQLVTDRHTILRTAFVWEDLDDPLQAVFAKVAIAVEFLDRTGLNAKEVAEEFSSVSQSGFFREPINLAIPPLFRVVLVQLAENDFLFVWNIHHVLMDGWSVPLLLREVFAGYEAACQGRQPWLPPVEPYRTYIGWLQEQSEAEAQKFWQETLAGFTGPNQLNGLFTVFQTSTPTEFAFDRKSIAFSPAETQTLTELARVYHLTLNSLVQGALARILGIYSQSNDVVFGVTTSGRPGEIPGVESMIGLFINTIPFRVFIDPEKKLVEWLQAVQRGMAEANRFDYVGLYQIQQWSSCPPPTPLFGCLLVFENFPGLEPGAGKESSSKRLQVGEISGFERTNYPLAVVAAPGRELHLHVTFDGNQFGDFAITALLSHLKSLLLAVAQHISAPVSSWIPADQRELEKLELFGQGPTTPLPSGETVVSLITRQMEQTPAATALVFGETAVTYQELAHLSSRIALHLVELGVTTEVPVAVFCQRSVELVAGILGIMQAGGCFVPLDPDTPVERLRTLLGIVQPRAILTQTRMGHLLPETTVPILDCEKLLSPQSAVHSPDFGLSPESAAYVLFTSGSTGTPKGVVVEHRSLLNYLLWCR